MALYTLKSEDEVMNPELYKNRIQGFAGLSANSPELKLFNMFGRGNNSGSNDNFFAKRGKSIENALGTTGATVAGFVDVARENDLNKKRTEDANKSIENIIKSHGYNSKDEFYDASDKAEKEIFSKYGFDSDDYWNKHAQMWSPAKANDKDVLDLEATRQNVIDRMSQEDADVIRKFDTIQDELKGQSKKNADVADKAAKDWKNYREDSYIGQKTNQDRGKFLGSAINTLSTAADVMLPGAGVAFNSIQGGVEGIADELEQNGLKDFDWNRAGQNALSGALTGAVVGGVNKGINNALAKNGGNLLKGGNKLTQAINRFNANNPIGQIGSTLASGATRGAISGAVGGATGAGLGAAMNGQDVLGSALQGAVQGTQQGAVTGGIMSGANMAINKTPGVSKVMRQLNEAGEDWNARKARGEDFNQRLTGTLTSGDSAVGEWLQGNKRSGALNTLHNIGGTIEDVNNMVDSTGRKIPLEIAEKLTNIDPKMLDKNGNVKVMYHGTPNGGFDRFDDGSYFTEDKAYADIYQNPSASSLSPKRNAANPMTYETYINAKKLFDINDNDARDIYINDYIKKGNAAGIDPYRDDYSDIKNIDWTEAENLREFLTNNRQYGYDGIIANEGGVPDDNGKVNYRGNSVMPLSGDQVIFRDKETPTTLGGWLKKAGQRVVEDINNRAPGMVVKDVSGDGMLDLEKGDKLPLQAKLKTLEEISGGQYKTIGDMIDDGMTMGDIKRVLPKRTYDELDKEIRKIADIKNPLEQMNQYNDASKSKLPQLNREQYYEETMGKVGKDRLSYKDVPDYMQSHLSNKITRSNDEILRSYFMDDGLYGNPERYTTSELYEMYDKIANGPNANEIFTSENINDALDQMNSGRNKGISDRIGNRLFGDERRLKIDGGAGRKKNVSVKNDNGRWESDIASRQEDAISNMMASMPEELRMPNDIRNMKINNGNAVPTEPTQVMAENPAMSVYNRVAQRPAEPIDLTESFNDKGLGNIEQRNKLQALGQQLQNSAKTQKYSPIYDSLDAKTAKRAAETNAPQQLADLGVKPQDYNEYAKTSSYVNRVVSDLAKKSGVKVNAPDLPSKLSADNIDVVMSDTALKKYNGYIKQIVPDGESPVEYSASYLLEKSRELGDKAANLRGNTDDVSALRQALTDAKYTLRDLATNALEGSLVTGDATNDMIAQGLKKLGANEKVQDYYTEATDGKAPSVSDYIRRSSLFEQARDMGAQVDAEKYTRSASKAPTRFATRVLRASGLEQPIETLLRNTVAPVASGVTNMAGKAIEGVGNAIAGARGGNASIADKVTPVATQPTPNANYNPATQLFNAIGRTEGSINAEQARNADYLANTAQEAEIVPNTTSQSATIPMQTNSSTALYENIGANPVQSTASVSNPSIQGNKNGYFPTTGDYWTDMIGDALTRAIDNDDVTAFAALFPMYKEAMSSVSKQTQKTSETSTANKKLTATQQRANAAMNSLEKISNMEPDLGYNLSGIPVIGNIATFGGNDYQAEATSLAQQIGYMVSGANIKQEEAEAIGKAYVPQPFDSESTRRNKLQRAYEIIQQYQNGYAGE